MDVNQYLQQGLAFHNAGDLSQAVRCYRAVLESDPTNVDALNLMSVLALQAGEARMAEDLARQAVAGDPTYFAAHLSLGNALQALGEVKAAAECFQRVVMLNESSAEGYCNLASALNALDRFDAANDAAVQALVLNPDMPAAHNNFGVALLGQGSAEEAAECFQKCVALDPQFTEGWHNLGNACAGLGDHEGALNAFAHALQIEATAERFYNLGNAFLALMRLDEAARCFSQAIEIDNQMADAWSNLSMVLRYAGNLAEAEDVQRAAVSLAPDDAEVHFNLATLLLQQGKYAEGWAEYEWRWGLPDFQASVRDFGKPRWDGAPLEGRTLLVSAEQGFGDAIQFCRLVPLAAARGGRVVLECRPGLERLFASLAGCAQVVPLGAPLPDFDVHVPLMSLPHILGLEVGRIPADVPYLTAPAGVSRFDDLAAVAGLKIGIAWAGKESRRDNRIRSCAAKDFAPLADLPGITLYSLQVGPAAGLGELAGRGNVHDLAPRLGDFADTAAAIAQLDLVISVDTSVAHLAGALGKPAWVLLSRPSNAFLWMEGRDDSPWYPATRLFRQPEAGDWAGLLSQVKQELAAQVAP
ncbi:MAG: tetratricopeptide repeat protein [Bacteroidales bacterium]